MYILQISQKKVAFWHSSICLMFMHCFGWSIYAKNMKFNMIQAFMMTYVTDFHNLFLMGDDILPVMVKLLTFSTWYMLLELNYFGLYDFLLINTFHLTFFLSYTEENTGHTHHCYEVDGLTLNYNFAIRKKHQIWKKIKEPVAPTIT